MFWVILTILFIGLSIQAYVLETSGKIYDGSAMAVTGIFGFVIFGFISLLVVWNGVDTYPDLLAKRQKALTYKSELDTIKKAYIKEKLPDNAIVGGSLTNIQYAKQALNYINKYINARADYNSSLVEEQALRKSVFSWIFGYGMFVSSDIYKLKPLK